MHTVPNPSWVCKTWKVQLQLSRLMPLPVFSVFPSLSPPSPYVCVCVVGAIPLLVSIIQSPALQESQSALFSHLSGIRSAPLANPLVYLFVCLQWSLLMLFSFLCLRMASTTSPAPSRATSVSCRSSANQLPIHRFSHPALPTHLLSFPAPLTPSVLVIKPFLSLLYSCVCLLSGPTKTKTLTAVSEHFIMKLQGMLQLGLKKKYSAFSAKLGK